MLNLPKLRLRDNEKLKHPNFLKLQQCLNLSKVSLATKGNSASMTSFICHPQLISNFPYYKNLCTVVYKNKIMFRAQNFEKLLDKATSNLKLEPDWPTIIQICDLIRQGDYPPKMALSSIKKKMLNSNPHVATFALLVLESLVKNCGHLVHDEIATKAFMEQLRELVKNTPHEQVKSKVLELVQAWAFAFRSNPKYHSVQETVNVMKAEGYKFPTLIESDAMFSADTAPEWVDANVCHRCRVAFSLVVRKHHCRACGNIFCGQCSSKNSTLPKFGFEKEVRVCDTCYELHNKPRSASPHIKNESESTAAEYLASSSVQQNHNPKLKKTEEELKEEEDIQLALALSQSEAEAKEKEKKRLTSEIINNAAAIKKTTPIVKEEEEDDDPELARYLNRSYWEKRHAKERVVEKKHSSPDHFRSSPGGPPSAPTTPTHHLENGEMQESELNEFVSYLKSQVEIFVNRMKSNSSRGRSISNDSSVQTLFMNVTMNHSTLLRYIHQQDDARVYYEGLQDKLAQVKDAMMALDALREEHREKLRREAEEAERQKQLQMAQKLEIMRRRKQEYLQYQRQLAIQKMQEQEREMHMRQEQQKQQYLMGSLGYSTWDSKMQPLQPPPHQYGQQYQSLPAGNPPSTGYVLPASSNISQQATPQMPGMVPPNVIPPGSLASASVQHPSRGAVQPQQGPQRIVQPNQVAQLPTPALPQMPSHMSTNYSGVPISGPNPPAGPSSMISHSQTLVMPPNGPVNVLLPPGAQQKLSSNMNLPPGSSGGPLPVVAPNLPQQGSQQRLQQGLPQSSLPSQNMTMSQVVPQNIPLQGGQPSVTQVVPQNSQFSQGRTGGEQSHSSSTGELISFD